MLVHLKLIGLSRVSILSNSDVDQWNNVLYTVRFPSGRDWAVGELLLPVHQINGRTQQQEWLTTSSLRCCHVLMLLVKTGSLQNAMHLYVVW